MNKHKIITVIFLVLLSITPLYAQTGIILETPRIYEGNVTNDSLFTGPIAVESTCTGEEPFMGLDKEAYYTLDAQSSAPLWNPASIEEKSIEYDFPLTGDMQTVDSSCAKGFADGRTIIVWKTLNASGTQSIYFQLFDAEGRKLGSEVQANTYINKRRISATEPDIAVLRNGDFIIAWDGMDTDSSLQYRVYGRRFNSNGAALDANEIELNHEVTFNDNFHPALMATAKDILSVWVNRKSEGGNTTSIEAMRYDYDGNPVGSKTVLVTENTDRYFLYPQITRLNEQEYILVWGQISTGIFLQKLILSNNILQLAGSKVTLVQQGPVQKSIRAAALADNGFVVVWSQTAGSGVRLYGQPFNNSCQTTGSRFQIDNYNDNTSSAFPHLSDTNDGGFVVCWRDYNSTLKQGTVMMKRYAASMNPVYQAVVKEKNTEITAFSACATGLKSLLAVWADRISSTSYERKATYYPARKRAYTGTITPQGNIDIRFKLKDPITQTEWVSPVRSYLNANPGEGANSTISYPGGFTNQGNVKVQINLEEGSYRQIAFYLQKAAVSDGQAGSFGEWESYGTITTQTKEMDVSLADGYAYKFKYALTNMADTTYQITSADVLVCDRTAPELKTVSDELEGLELRLVLAYSDQTSGIDKVSCSLNLGDPAVVSANELQVALVVGANHLVLEAADRAGNKTTRHIFRNAEGVYPEIRLIGIREGGEYGSKIVFGYTAAVALSNIGAYVDDNFEVSADNSPVTIDLSGYAAGRHKIAVRGQTNRGEWLEGAAGILLNPGIFNLVLLSPQEGGRYGSKKFGISYWSEEPLEEVWWQLDGGDRQEGTELSGLSDGSHELRLYAIDEKGNRASTTAVFSVKENVAELKVISPVDGQVCGSKEIELVFDTNASVSYELGDESGNAVSGTVLTAPDDGSYVLTLTATHPVSGNIIRQRINLVVDSVEPELEIITPEARLYGYGEINAEYRTNKAVKELKELLDGNEVKQLSNLEPGSHRYEVAITDYAGRSVTKRVDFTVARLEIVKPEEGARIVSDSQPPAFTFVYEKEGNFDSLTRALDDNEGELIVDPPGQEIPMVTEAGKHELELRGYLDEFKIARRNRFQVGRKNLSVKSGSINYSYSRVGSSEDYDVDVVLTVGNTGDLDIDEAIQVRFDYISQEGTVTTWWKELPGIKSKEEGKTDIERFTARFGDHFLVTVDPDKNLNGEYAGDNSYEIEFQTGQITGISQVLAEENVYLQNVSVFNTIEVNTAGSIAYVELRTNSKVFVDDTPGNGFRSIVDMGLLSPLKNYVQVLAYGFNNVLLDSRKFYLNIRKLPDAMGGHYFPWSYVAYESSGDYDRINISKVDFRELTYLQVQALITSNSQPPCVTPEIKEDKSIVYNIMSLDQSFKHYVTQNNPSAVSETLARSVSFNESGARVLSAVKSSDNVTPGRFTDTIDMGGTPVVGGEKEVPNGMGYMYLSSLDPTNYLCAGIGSLPFNKADGFLDYNDLILEKGEQLLSYVYKMIVDGLDLEKVLKDSMRKVFDNVYDTINGSILDWSTGTMTSAAIKNKDNFDISVSALKITGEMTHESKDCTICNKLEDILHDPEIMLESEDVYQGVIEGNATITVKPKRNITVGEGVRMFLFIPFGYNSGGKIEFETLNIPLYYRLNTGATSIRRDLEILLNPVHTKFNESVAFEHRPLLSGAIGRNILFGLVSDNINYSGEITIKANADADIINTPNPNPVSSDDLHISKVYYYAEGSLDARAGYTTTTCIFWGLSCWDNHYTILNEHKTGKIGDPYPDRRYSDTEVEEYIKSRVKDFSNPDITSGSDSYPY